MNSPAGRPSGLALVLTGGGARAAYQVGVLRAIAEAFPEMDFPIITGVSAGAINAAYLAGHRGPLGRAVEGLRGEWGRLTSEKIYGVRVMELVQSAARGLGRIALRRRGRPPLLKGLFDTEPLRRFLQECLAFDGIDANVESGALRAVALSATSYATGETVTFVHGGPHVPTWERAHRVAVRARLGLDHVMASSAIPIIFPAVWLGDGFYGDGSVRQNFPLSPAIHLGARRILAIGTRPARSSPGRAATPRDPPSPARAMGLLLDSVFMDHLDADAEGLTRVNGLVRALRGPSAAESGLRAVDFFMLRPSRDLGAIAADWSHRLPKPLRYGVEGLGGDHRGGADFLSYLLFDPEFTSRLMDLGYADSKSQWPMIERLLARPDPPMDLAAG